ncbi:MAG TPA: VWA domain-containing protein [Bryobacteraceae bacterium]|nr:VWA domain-containing protein [Bryobacteraceae bacterium]
MRIRSAAWFPPGLVISADASLVELAATVRDRQGHLVGGLHASDFEVLDNKQPREITFFSEETRQPAGGSAPASAAKPSMTPVTAPPPEPRTIALFFDDGHASMLGVHKSAEAAARLVTNNLQPNDLVGIFTSSGTTSVDFTRNRDLLLAAIARLRPHPLSGVSAATSCPTLDSYAGYVIPRHLDPAVESAALAEAIRCNCSSPPTPQCVAWQRTNIDLAARTEWEQTRYQYTTDLEAMGIVIRHLAGAPGRRMLVLMSPGFPSGDMQKQTSALIDAALRANIRIGGLNSEGLSTRMSSARGMVLNEFMTAAAKSTGGQFHHDTNDWFGGLEAATALPEVSYVLGFSPPGEPDGNYHALRTSIRGNRSYSVETRTGYFAAPPAAGRETVQQRIDRIAMSSTDQKDFPVTLEVRQEPAPEGQARVQVTIAVDAGGLRFAKADGRRLQELTFLTVLEDAQGNFVAGQQSVIDMVLAPATFTQKLQTGIRAATSLSVPQRGSYRVREVVRELVQNRIWASDAPIQVR